MGDLFKWKVAPPTGAPVVGLRPESYAGALARALGVLASLGLGRRVVALAAVLDDGDGGEGAAVTLVREGASVSVAASLPPPAPPWHACAACGCRR